MVGQPIFVKPSCPSGRRATTLSQPPAAERANGTAAAKPNTMKKNCTKSVRVTDHMPPSQV